MAKVLNLEGLTKRTRSVTFGGTSHFVKEMSVGDFIEVSAKAKELAGITDPVQQIQATVDLISRSIPTLNKAVLMDQSIDNLMVISRFIQGEMDGDEQVTDDGVDVKK